MSSNGAPIAVDVVAQHALRFWARVDTTDGDSSCWPYLGGCDPTGYGVFYADSRKYLAHRFAYTFAKGPITPSLVVRHACDRPPCCNPAHLEQGTQHQNVHDCIERDRAVLVKPSPGSSNGQAQLTEEDVETIRRRARRGERGNDLATWPEDLRVRELPA